MNFLPQHRSWHLWSAKTSTETCRKWLNTLEQFRRQKDAFFVCYCWWHVFTPLEYLLRWYYCAFICGYLDSFFSNCTSHLIVSRHCGKIWKMPIFNRIAIFHSAALPIEISIRKKTLIITMCQNSLLNKRICIFFSLQCKYFFQISCFVHYWWISYWHSPEWKIRCTCTRNCI